MKFDVYSPLEKVSTSFLNRFNVQLDIKRDDMIHPFISGNKWRKLKYNLLAYQSSGRSGILTYGGAFSNHLIATAAACAKFKIPCIGVVRGDELSERSNIVLRLCAEFGMELKFISRADYKLKLYPEGNNYLIPEGGDNIEGVKGCEEIMTGLDGYNHVFVSVGTSTTFKGVINGSKGIGHIHGVAALKGADYLKKGIAHDTFFDNWTLHSQFCGNGFGKYSEAEVKFNSKFATETGILLDPIYTGKSMKALYDLVSEGVIKPSERVLFIHTGGLTGVMSSKWLDVKRI